MGTNERPQSPCLDLLEQRGEEFNFFQAIRLLENIPCVKQNIRFKAVNSEAFHPNFIADITQKSNLNEKNDSSSNKVTVSVNGFGLVGQQGPIPQCFSETLRRAFVEGPNGREEPEAFLNIFNDKLVALLYDIKKQFNPLLFNELPVNSSLYELLAAITGFGTLNLFSRLPLSGDQLAAFAPIMANRRIDYSLLNNVLKNHFDCELEITPNQGAWRPLPKKYRAQLNITGKQNSGSILGQGIGLGKKYWDPQAAIAITINVQSLEQCLSLLPPNEQHPTGEQHQQLISLFSFLTDGKYSLFVTLKIRWQDIPDSLLVEDSSMRLGQTSWLHTDKKLSSRLTIPTFVIEPSLQYQYDNTSESIEGSAAA